ncbi:hypothetical protein DERP_011390 [Dermatophagoides pteronyssinus]|uniref:Uncharacterized protein n=1 Tax=Dermatophagoides pteronyssinus TaxID=6956 RepID=A0ABQ8IRP8_DERPT|nr:hypothetical protein DERP_013258 [Dermatophagoides pteronyssinus]KAH9417679.1 hypothetical protein DERP_011390 [Dermatophagoides pteronyssinus]
MNSSKSFATSVSSKLFWMTFSMRGSNVTIANTDYIQSARVSKLQMSGNQAHSYNPAVLI